MRSHTPSIRSLFLCYIALLAAGSLQASPVIYEIHYHNDRNYIANEFIELYNPGLQAVNLGGWKLTGGIEYIFPENSLLEAGAYISIAENPSVLRSEFPSPQRELRILGPYSGALSGEGEMIDLLDNSGAVTYTHLTLPTKRIV